MMGHPSIASHSSPTGKEIVVYYMVSLAVSGTCEKGVGKVSACCHLPHDSCTCVTGAPTATCQGHSHPLPSTSCQVTLPFTSTRQQVTLPFTVACQQVTVAFANANNCLLRVGSVLAYKGASPWCITSQVCV